jgi:hypothetical protein
MPVHHCVFKIETLQITDGGGFDLLRKAEKTTELGNFGNI